MARPVAISDASFDREVVQADKPVLVDFWAAWCPPCRMLAPVLDQLADEYADSLKVVKLDIDANRVTPERLDVRSFPTLILFKDGTPVERIVGFQPRTRLLAKIRPHIGVAVA